MIHTSHNPAKTMKLLLLNLLSLLAPAVYAQTATNNEVCDTGPNSITTNLASYAGFSANVPRTCVAATGTQGGERCFFTYVPDCAGADSPLVFDIHGLGSCPLFSTAYTGWIQRARDECFVLVMPLGTIDPEVADDTCFAVPGGMPSGDGLAQETTSCCCEKGGAFILIDTSITNDADLMRFIAKTVTETVPLETEGRVTIDTTRIYMAGHSNGCITSLSMAALHSDMVAAVCCHAGVSVTDFAADYSAVPVWMAYGAKDTDLPAEGRSFGDPFFVPGPPAVFSLFADKNGCEATENVSSLDEGGNVVGNVKTRSNCDNGKDVTFVTLFDSGHTPYKGSDENSVGASVTTVDTSAMAWEFCSRFSLSEAPDLAKGIVFNTLAPDPTPAPTPLPTTAPVPATPVPTTSAPTSSAAGVAMEMSIQIGTIIVIAFVFM
jgi:poly(3-hydroxybutyrate) depolymerase